MACCELFQELYEKLFELISVDEQNEDEILEILNNKKHERKFLHKIINKPAECRSGSETMLMWAIWRLKKDTVVALLRLGADFKYTNELGEGCSTYWDPQKIRENQELAIDIARILHMVGVYLSKPSDYGYSLVKRAEIEKFTKLTKVLKELGY